MNAEILKPVIALAAWSTIMWIWLYTTRLPAMARAGIDGTKLVGSTGKSLRDQLKEGDVLDGTVRKIMPFGAFVDIGGVDGLVHVGDLTHERVGMGEQAIAKHIKEGQQVKVKILKIEWNDEDMRKSRIGLGLKQLSADPFQTAVADIKEGAEVAGKVTRLSDFGAWRTYPTRFRRQPKTISSL